MYTSNTTNNKLEQSRLDYENKIWVCSIYRVIKLTKQKTTTAATTTNPNTNNEDHAYC